jgi:hypothetical protein
MFQLSPCNKNITAHYITPNKEPTISNVTAMTIEKIIHHQITKHHYYDAVILLLNLQP